VCLSASAIAIDHRGRVTANQLPIPGATVIAVCGERKLVTTTDEEGNYLLEGLEPGICELRIEMFGFAPARRTVHIEAGGGLLEWTLELLKPPSVPTLKAPLAETNLAEEWSKLQETPAEPEPTAEEQDANEAFLIQGSLSRGLELGAAPEAPASLPGSEHAPPAPLVDKPARAPAIAKGTPKKAGALTRLARARVARKALAAKNFGNRRRGGSDNLRGAFYASWRNSALDARPFSLTGQSAPKPPYSHTRFGFMVGGPLRIPKLIESDRSFIFLNFTGVRSRNPYQATGTLPSPAERAGDFSASAIRAPVTIYDPTSRTPFPGNLLPAQRIDPVAQGLLEFIPPPNQPGRVQNYRLLESQRQNTDNFALRFSQPLERRHRLSVSLNWQRRSGENLQPFGFRDENSTRGWRATLSWSYNLQRRLVHNLSWEIQGNRHETLPYFAFKRNVAAELGIIGPSTQPENWGPPNLSFTNFSDLTEASAIERRDRSSALTDSLTLMRGRHNFTFGGEYRRVRLDSRTDQNARGSFTFSGLVTSGLDARGQPLPFTGFDFADFLLGLPQSSSIRYGSSNNYFRGTAYNLFWQDDWRLHRHLTLNNGLRYEFSSPLREKFGRLSNLDIAPGFTGAAVVTPGSIGPYSGRFPEALIDPDRNNFSPRLGLAWRAGNHTVLRAGYGVFYDSSVYNRFAPRLASQPPFANTGHLTTSLARPLTLRDGLVALPATTIRNTFAVDRSYRLGYAQTWRLSIQRDFASAYVFELGYLGTKGTRLDIQRSPNRAAPGSPLTAEQRRQIANAVGFIWDSSEGNSIYHGLEARLTRRFRRGLSFNAIYTWSKSIDNASSIGGAGNVVAQNDRDLRAERGLSSFDRRHALTLSYVLTSPSDARSALLTRAGRAAWLLRNWNLSGQLTLQTGSPFTARVMGNRADSGGTGVIGSGRADATGQPVKAPGWRFFNLEAFTTPPPGRFGNAGRNTIPGPGFAALNAALGRSFRVGESRRWLEIRLEASNLTNHVNYTRLDTVVNSLNYGLATQTAPMRALTATLRYRF